MRDRRYTILKAIIESFISHAEPVGSKSLLDEHSLGISSATIRSEMAKLEDMGLIYQPHTSAGRIPTDKGFRMFVDYLMEEVAPEIFLHEQKEALTSIQKQKDEDRVYQAVSLLSRVCPNVCFATIPHAQKAYFLGISSILRSPEYQENISEAYTIIKVLEDTDNFVELLSSLAIDDNTRVFIGEENVIREIKSCSIIATRYQLNNFSGVIGILGPKRMNYAFNIGALKAIKDEIE